jgi:xanthine dehydrogenase YagT iron-sulfur-binding subunit
MPEHDPNARGGHSRRDFLRGSGLAAASAVLTTQATQALDEADAAEVQQGPKVVEGETQISLKVNGESKQVSIEPRCTLLDTLRNRLDVTGPKRVCDRASCGACTVILNGEPVYSCTTLAITCQDKEIQTLESFDEAGVPASFVANDGLMCGYCTPGFVTACKALLDKNPNPTLEEVKQGLDGNICRCGTYMGVFQAALEAAKTMRKEA